MLQLKPNCEHCDKPLPPNSTEAMICSYECTFCQACVVVLENVCPNCGGGFCLRPHRPVKPYVANNSLIDHPASTKKVLKPVNLESHSEFCKNIKHIPPENR